MRRFLAVLLACWPFSALAQVPPPTTVTNATQLIQALAQSKPLICAQPGTYMTAQAKNASKTVTMATALAAAICMATGPTPAAAWVHGTVAASTRCPYDGGGFADGCDAAPTGADTQVPNWLSIAAQNGQRTTLPSRPMGWNIPGVDYPVGANDATLVQAQSATSANMPAGCAYQTTGGGINGTAPRIYCASVASPTIQNVDFSNGGTNCVTLEFATSVSGAVVGNNLKFGGGFNCGGVTPTNGWLIDFISENALVTSWVFESVTFDETGDAATPLATDIQDKIGPRHTGLLVYFAVKNATGHVMSGSPGKPLDLEMEYGFIHNITMGFATDDQIHGEINANTLGGTSGSPITVDYLTCSFCTVWFDNTMPLLPGTFTGSTTTAFYLGTGLGPPSYATFTNVDVDHSVIVTNANVTADPGHAYPPISAAGWELPEDTFTAATFVDDYIDPNGAAFCTVGPGRSYSSRFHSIPFHSIPFHSIHRFIDDGSGAGTYSGIAGSVLTIAQTGTPHPTGVEVTNHAWFSGTDHGTITSVKTAWTGAYASFNLSSASQLVTSSTVLITYLPTTMTWTNVIDLYDGSSLTGFDNVPAVNVCQGHGVAP